MTRLLLLLPAVGCTPAPCGQGAHVQLDPDVDVCASVAVTEAERRAGLTALPALGPGDGLLLQYPTSIEACITTAAMTYAIDVVFADATGRVTAVACNRGPEAPVTCAPDVLTVLEVLPRAVCPDWVGAQLRLTP